MGHIPISPNLDLPSDTLIHFPLSQTVATDTNSCFYRENAPPTMGEKSDRGANLKDAGRNIANASPDSVSLLMAFTKRRRIAIISNYSLSQQFHPEINPLKQCAALRIMSEAL